MATVFSPPQGRVTLHNISWALYEHLLAEHADKSSRVLCMTGENWRSLCLPMSMKRSTG